MPKPRICQTCGEPVKPLDEQPGCAMGVIHHRICFDIATASLAEELKCYMRSRPDLYEELPNGNFRPLQNDVPEKEV